MEAATVEPGERSRRGLPAWMLGLAPLVLIAVVAAVFGALGAPGLGERRGPPAEELVVERTTVKPGRFELTIRNDGPDAVRVAQVLVNDAYAEFRGATSGIGHLATEKITIDQPWIEGEAYAITLLTSTGGTIAHDIPIAVATKDVDGGFFALLALLGIYVGIIPVTMGMLWLPWVRRIPPAWLQAIMALTIGLLAFLAIDATLEGVDVAGQGSQALGGTGLVIMGALAAYLVLSGISAYFNTRKQEEKAAGASGARLSFLIAGGIGLHNLGEGLAIGAAYTSGALALGAFLVVGFALHNTTEGLAIVAPLSNEPVRFRRLAALGALAGLPAIIGAWIGAAAVTPALTALLLGVGAGAIVQVAVQIAPAVRDAAGRLLHPVAVTGALAGLVIMLSTSLLVSV
jgi:zinc transporter ZupT